MLLLSVQDVVKHYGPEPVLDGVTFEMRAGDRVGLVGPNGAGKSTLMRLLAGLDESDRGEIALHPSATLRYLEQHPEFAPGRTVWEEALEGLGDLLALGRRAEEAAHELASASDANDQARLGQLYDRLQAELQHRKAFNLDHRVEEILQGLGFTSKDFQQQATLLSGGQKNRLLLGKLLLADPDLMLLDEPSNHLDIEATTWLEEYLASRGTTFLIVSHDRYLLDKTTNRTLELFDGTVEEYSGNFSAYWRQKDDRLKVQQKTFERQQEFIAKTEDFIRRNHYGQKSAQAEDRRKKLERVERVARPRLIEGPPIFFPQAQRCGDIVLRVERLSKAFAKPLFSGLTFDILRGQRWGILGPNGTGKTTLLRCIVGEHKADQGRVILGTGVQIGYADQLLSGLDPDTPLVDAIRPPGKEMNEPRRRDHLARFGLRSDIVFQRVGSLSGGERSRAALARVAALDCNLLILDEPTNHLDLWARDCLEEAIRTFDGTVLLVSHDRYFLNRVVDHLLVVEPAGFRVIDGNYDTYMHLVSIGAAGGTAQTSELKGGISKGGPKPGEEADSRKRGGSTTAKKKRKFPYRKVADLEADILGKETLIEALRASLSTPEVYKDGQKARQVHQQVLAEEAALQLLYEHWEEASELN